MAMPSTGGETDASAPHSKKPYGHDTARLLTRLPIARFRRCIINRSGGKWLHRDGTILQADAGWRQITAQAMATSGRDR
jgi:hypothetical protein